MSNNALLQVRLRSSRQDGAPEGEGKEDDAEVRLQEKRNLACQLLATECEKSRFDSDQDRENIEGFREVFQGLEFQEFMRLFITGMQRLDKRLYNKKVCSRVLNEAWAHYLVCGIKLGEWASGKEFGLHGLSDQSIETFRGYIKSLAKKVYDADMKDHPISEDTGSPESVCDMSICI
jgi:hypothetical protein